MVKRACFLPIIVIFMACLWSNLAYAPLAVNPISNVVFGQLIYSGNPTSTVKIGTDSLVSYGVGVTGDGLGSPGRLVITDDNSRIIDIGCAASAVLQSSGNNLTFSSTETVMGTSNAGPFGSGVPCQGEATVIISHIITSVASSDSLLIAGQLDLSTGAVVSGLYDTGGGSSVPLKFRITRQ